MRCGVTACRHRWALKKHPDQYKRSPKCPKCSDVTKVRSIEMERRRELAKQITCRCSSYPFPHRQGSLRFCEHHPRIDEDPTMEECLDYEGCLATPRSG